MIIIDWVQSSVTLMPIHENPFLINTIIHGKKFFPLFLLMSFPKRHNYSDFNIA